MASWICILELDESRSVSAGSEIALCDAVRRGADLRIGTVFRHNEHIDVTSDNPEVIREVADFRVAYLLNDCWTAGIMTLRQPISLPDGFGPRPSMSLFLYNQNGQQAIARPYLDGGPVIGALGPSPLDDHRAMPKYHQLDNWDAGTNAPSSNFIYDFDLFRFFVRDDWQEVLSHTADGRVISGSVGALAEAVTEGCEVKVGIRGLCADLMLGRTTTVDHEVFVQAGSCYYYTQRRLFIAGTHPVVRAQPAIPLCYVSQGWDFGWLMPLTDGLVARLLYDPYTLVFQRSEGRYAIRWFVR
ncbi:MAG: hypothetical protein HY709_08005 [Candidatus Latescibacteria bacterium]|nr:hypothetical protein [Candidatus Latescibacterota bacterium]